MKKRLMLPMMAFVFAIGLSFATERTTADAASDWVDMGGEDPVEITEVNCGEGTINCSVKFAGDDIPYPVFEDKDLQIRKTGSGNVIEL